MDRKFFSVFLLHVCCQTARGFISLAITTRRKSGRESSSVLDRRIRSPTSLVADGRIGHGGVGRAGGGLGFCLQYSGVGHIKAGDVGKGDNEDGCGVLMLGCGEDAEKVGATCTVLSYLQNSTAGK